MPQVGNKCPGIQEYHTFESSYCLNDCDHQCVPASVLVHIQSKQRVDKHIGEYLSVTSLLGCLRQLYLERTLEYYVEPPKSWWSLRGKILHHLLENPGDVEIPNWESESEYEWPTGEYVCLSCGFIFTAEVAHTVCPSCSKETVVEVKLRGTIDVLRPLTGEMYDYKTIGDNGLAYIKNGAKPDHIMQFNMYRLLVERGYPVGKKDSYTPVKINKITAFYMTMMQIARTGGMIPEVTDWRVSNPPAHPNMVGEPELLGTRERLKLKKGKRKETAEPDDYELQIDKKFRLTYAVPEVPLMDLEEVASFVRNTAPILISAFKFGKMPPMCPPEMRAWKCDNYCPDQIRHACDAYNAKTGEKRVVEVELNKEIPLEAVA
jgi:DNA-directed RNA polymerase subunit RPC12/RpoP